MFDNNSSKKEHENKLCSKSYANDTKARIELECGHIVSKDHLIRSAIELFLFDGSHNYNCFCESCDDYKGFGSFLLDCGCVWRNNGEEAESITDIDDIDQRECPRGIPLVFPIFHSKSKECLALVRDYPSFKLVSLLFMDYSNSEMQCTYEDAFKPRPVEEIV